MRIQDSVNAGPGIQTQEVAKEQQNPDKKTKSKQNESVYAGNLNLGDDLVVRKRKQALDIALQLKKNAWDKDISLDDEIEDRLKHAKELEKQNQENQEEIQDLKEREESIRNGFGVELDSREQKDLELLKKREATNWDKSIKLTDEEKEKLQEIDSAGKTAYQEEALKIFGAIHDIEDEMLDNKVAMYREYGVVRGISIERLKTHDMVDAKVQGEQIQQAANKEVLGLLIQDGVDKIDEDNKIKEEEAEKIKEEAKAQEERIKASKERNAEFEEEMYELLDDVEDIKTIQKNDSSEDMKDSMELMVAKLQLSTEDLKGLVVDSAT